MKTTLPGIEKSLSLRAGLAVAAAAACFLTGGAVLSDPVSKIGGTAHSRKSSVRIAVLHHDPQFILHAVARRMGITLRPDVPVPTLLLESKTPLSRLQVAAQRQWGMRPGVFLSVFAPGGNEIYLIDDAAVHERRGGTIDDSLAHELVHYLQARYRKDSFDTEWSEFEAVAVQVWFRTEHMEPSVVAVDARSPR
jgi:hypothetical protein